MSAVKRIEDAYREEGTQWGLVSDPKRALALFLAPNQLLSDNDSCRVSSEKQKLLKLREQLPRVFLCACAIAFTGFVGMIVLMSLAAAANR